MKIMTFNIQHCLDYKRRRIDFDLFAEKIKENTALYIDIGAKDKEEAQAVVSLGLGAIGFVEGEKAVQPEGFGEDVKNLYFIVLATGSLIAFLAMKFIYNIGKKEEAEISAMSAN